MSKVRIAVVGCGNMGYNVHIPSFLEIPECEIIAICELDQEKLDIAGDKFGIAKRYRFHTDLLAAEKDNLDGIVCLAEPDRQYRLVYDCLMAGIPTFMEKPAGINAYQADSLAATSKKTGVPCGVMLNRRYTPLIVETLRIMNELTTINHVDGVFIKHSEIGETWHYMDAFISDIIHATDLVRYIAGGKKVVKVATVAKQLNDRVLNGWNSVFQFDNGVTGSLKANYQTASRVHTFEIHGADASAYINLGFSGEPEKAIILKSANAGGIYSRAAGGVNESDRIELDAIELAGGESKYYQYYGYKDEDKEFIQSLIEKRPTKCTIEDAALSMHMSEDILKAIL